MKKETNESAAKLESDGYRVQLMAMRVLSDADWDYYAKQLPLGPQRVDIPLELSRTLLREMEIVGALGLSETLLENKPVRVSSKTPLKVAVWAIMRFRAAVSLVLLISYDKSVSYCQHAPADCRIRACMLAIQRTARLPTCSHACLHTAPRAPLAVQDGLCKVMNRLQAANIHLTLATGDTKGTALAAARATDLMKRVDQAALLDLTAEKLGFATKVRAPAWVVLLDSSRAGPAHGRLDEVHLIDPSLWYIASDSEAGRNLRCNSDWDEQDTVAASHFIPLAHLLSPGALLRLLCNRQATYRAVGCL